MLSYEYIQFLNEKILSYLACDRVIIGDKINFRCPLCGDSHKSAVKKRGWYYMKNASFYCFNCGVGLSGIKFLQMLSGNDYDDIKKEYVRLFLKSNLSNSLSSYFDKPDEEPDIFNLKSIVKPEWKKPLTESARAYLNSRLILNAPFYRDEVFSCSGKNNMEYIIIPWVVNGVDAYYQLNDFKKYGQIKYIFPKNKHKLVYGLDNIDLSWNKIIVFEGVYDSLFVKNGIAVGTKSITNSQIKLIKDRYPNHKICISFDNDEPGFASMQKMIEDSKHDFYFFKWFDKNEANKDINEYVIQHNDVSCFSDRLKLDKLVLTSLQMKIWLIKNGKWKNSSARKINKTKYQLKMSAAFNTLNKYS